MASTKRNAQERKRDGVGGGGGMGEVTKKFEFFQGKVVTEGFQKITHRTARL